MSKVVNMGCGVIQDLLPLYIDKCCSEESIEIVESHLAECEECKSVFDSMSSDAMSEEKNVSVPHKLSRINDWKASVLQTVLLFVSFAVLAVGITLEAYTPYGVANGMWAFGIIVPFSSFILSLSNWFFIRIYKNRRIFSNCSSLFTLIVSAFGFMWAVVHFKITFVNFSGSLVKFLVSGIVVAALLCVVSKVASEVYAKMLGKE